MSVVTCWPRIQRLGLTMASAIAQPPASGPARRRPVRQASQASAAAAAFEIRRAAANAPPATEARPAASSG